MQQKFFLIDGMSLVYRAHFALSKNPRITSTGINTSAIMVFFNALLEMLKVEKPTHLCVSFDSKESTIRHEIFEEYKSNRLIIPEDIVVALKYIKEILNEMGICIIQKPGYEADDIIGTLAKQAENQALQTYIMTPDKDFAQLVSKKIFIYKHTKAQQPVNIIDEKAILTSWQVMPKQVPDVLGLWGDASDNIPGVPGIGEKTAKKLIKEYGSIEHMIDNLDNLKGKIHDNIKEFQTQALLSKKLATIITDVDINYNIQEFEIKPIKNKSNLEKIFKYLEFNTLTKRILGDYSNKGENLFSQTANNNKSEAIKDNCIKLKDFQEISKLLEKLDNVTELSLAAKITDYTIKLGLSYNSKNSYYLKIDTRNPKYKNICERLKYILEKEELIKISYNIKQLLPAFRTIEIDLKPKYFDTMIAHYLLDPEGNRNFLDLAKTYLHLDIIENINEDAYLAKIAHINLGLKEKFNRLLNENNLLKLAEQIEFPLIYVLYEIERVGIKIDLEALNIYDSLLTTDLEKIKNNIYVLAGKNFNLASPKQLGEILFTKIIPYATVSKTKTGQYKTDESTLQALIKEHKIIPKIIEYRMLNKLKSTYVDTFKKLLIAGSNTLHTTFNQASVSTGRLSSTNPNLQNIPIKTERGQGLRKIFIPSRKENFLLSADYSQIELRILAHIADEENMIDAFNNNEDIHISTASKIFSIPLNKVSVEQRRIAKTVNFGIVYGQSAFGLSQTLGISRKEAKQIIEEYFNKYPSIQTYMNKSIANAKDKGFVETLLNRRRYFRDINSANAVMRAIAERNAINSPIQGTAADIIKIAMVNIYKELQKQKLKSNIVLQIHDELLIDIPKDELESVENLAIKLMREAINLKVELKVNYKIAKNWSKI